MNWREYNAAGLHRLRQVLADGSRTLAEADAWLASNGRTPHDPLRLELQSVIRNVAALADQVRENAHEFAPYRPLCDPWIRQGLAAKVRPDFAARGITNQRHQP